MSFYPKYFPALIRFLTTRIPYEICRWQNIIIEKKIHKCLDLPYMETNWRYIEYFKKKKHVSRQGGGCLDKFSSGSIRLYNFEIFLRACVMAMFYNYVTFMYSIVHQMGI